MESYHNESTKQLMHALSLLKNEEEFTAFLDDLCTIQEIQAMAQRLDAAILLKEQKNYLQISKEVGLSTATISRVSRSIKYGTGGYATVIDRLLEEKKQKQAE